MKKVDKHVQSRNDNIPWDIVADGGIFEFEVESLKLHSFRSAAYQAASRRDKRCVLRSREQETDFIVTVEFIGE